LFTGGSECCTSELNSRHDFGDFENNKIELFLAQLNSDLIKHINYYEKFRWVADYFIVKTKVKVDTSGNEYKPYFELACKL